MAESEIGGADLTGRLVDRRFEVVDKLGEGGMGAIYRAKQLSVNRMVALKLLLRDRRGDPISAERFKHEAYLASRLRHPNAVVIYDFGQADDGLLYIAMELLAGLNLKELMQSEGALGHQRATRIMLQTLRPIAQAHGMGLVHRDLKPANIFLTQVEGDPDFVKVLDFGVAKLTAVQDSVEGYQGGLTVAGKIYGTPNYMSPEQIRGKDVDQHSDLYSLGIIFYEMLCGKRPFEADTPVDVMMMHLRDEAAPPSSVDGSIPRVVDDIALKALAKDPKDRYDTAEEFIEALVSLGVSSGAFGQLRSERGGEQMSSSVPPSVMASGAMDLAGEVEPEISITGLGFDDGDFDDEFQDEKTVLEVDESIDVDFSVGSIDIESESLDRSQQDTLFQAAADDSMRALFDRLGPEGDVSRSVEPDDSSQLDALNVESDEFGLDEPSKLVPIPAPKPQLKSALNPHKQTQMGYRLDANDGFGLPSKAPAVEQASSAQPKVAAAADEKAPASTVRSMEALDSKQRADSAADGELRANRADDSSDRLAASDKVADMSSEEKTPVPSPNEKWASAFESKPIMNSNLGTFAMPQAKKQRKKTPRMLYALVFGILVAGGVVGYILTSGEPTAPPVIVLNQAENLAESADVFVSGIQLNAASPSLSVEKKDLFERDVLVIPKNGKGSSWNFTLPVIVEPTELVLLFDDSKVELGRFRAKGSDGLTRMSVDGRAISQAWVVVVGHKGSTVKLTRAGPNGPKTTTVTIAGGDALQIVDF